MGDWLRCGHSCGITQALISEAEAETASLLAAAAAEEEAESALHQLISSLYNIPFRAVRARNEKEEEE